MKSYKKFSLIIIAFSALCALTIYISNAGAKQDPHFSYNSGDFNRRYVQIMPGWPIDVPFSFDIAQGTTEVDLELVDAEILLGNGIELKNKTVSTVNGIASSKAMFDIQKDNAMKPGTYYIQIQAKDRTTGEVIRTGKIPYIFNMEQTVARCSC